MAYSLVTPRVGVQGITVVDTVQNLPLGTLVRATDPTYGEGAFIYMKGIASVAVGDVCSFDIKAGTATRSVGATRGPVGVAMAAVVANTYGWFQVEGSAVINCAAAISAGALVYVSATAGSLSTVVAAQKVDGAVCTTASVGAGTIVAQIMQPSANGNG